ncbi:MAG: DUF1127 domain-containing protein [Marinosulfonomonas sp.]|nr:DUF1127 domain-containing protein [Marinosulfonomonas sp.]
MATYENTRLLVDGARGSDFGISRVAYRFVGFVTDLSYAIAHWNGARKTRKELSKLSDHALEDIGLSRGDIAAFSTGHIYH